MTRLEAMEQYISSYRVMWTKERIEEAKKEQDHLLIEKMKELFEKAIQKQNVRSWTPAYLSVFYLNSSTYTRTFEYLICLSNDQIYLDDEQLNTFWRPSFIGTESEDEGLKKLLQKKFVRVKDYEVSHISRLFETEYKKITEVYIRPVFETITKEYLFANLNKNESFTFAYGNYMGEIKSLKTFESRPEQ